MSNTTYEILQGNGVPIKAWTRGVPFEEEAKQQLLNISEMPFIYKWIAVMPDVHLGKGATVGSVIATTKAIIPAAVGVDIGCGMMAVQTNMKASNLPDDLGAVRAAIEKAVPNGRTNQGKKGRDEGAWGDVPTDVAKAWELLAKQFEYLAQQHPVLNKTSNIQHLGTLGTGNHFIEVCIGEDDSVWFMLHSGSRGVGNRIGTYFIEKAQQDMERLQIQLSDIDLAYLREGTEDFNQYIEAVEWAQQFAQINREVMMARVLAAAREVFGFDFNTIGKAIDCHHNYVARESHYGESVFVTRKGAISAFKNQLGIIPGSMGVRSYIVKGLGNEESFCSCSHGAGRVMSRKKAKESLTLEQHLKATEGVECKKDLSVIDETPAAYKDIDKVMHAQRDLTKIVHTLKQVVCVKG